MCRFPDINCEEIICAWEVIKGLIQGYVRREKHSVSRYKLLHNGMCRFPDINCKEIICAWEVIKGLIQGYVRREKHTNAVLATDA
jgi:hypothetical protein